SRRGNRGRDSGSGRRVPRDAVVVQPLHGLGAAHLRLRGRRHRRHGLAVGDPPRGDRARDLPEHRRADQSAVVPARGEHRAPGDPGRAARPRRTCRAWGSLGGRGKAGVSEPGDVTVERWTRVSVVTSAVLVAVLAFLALVPILLSANATDKLT